MLDWRYASARDASMERPARSNGGRQANVATRTLNLSLASSDYVRSSTSVGPPATPTNSSPKPSWAVDEGR